MPKLALTRFPGMYRPSTASHSCANVSHFFREFPHKTKIFSETVGGISFKFGHLLDEVKNKIFTDVHPD